ncbi:MAG: O-antigen ligase family protein [Bacteroidales bacterium]|nr:O-antigen ligase family protein [Bacteroidales bacterium]
MVSNKWILSDDLYQKLVFFCLAIMIIAVPSSRFLMSISQIGLLALWLVHGHWKEKWQQFINNKAALVLVSFFLLHVIGVFYSTDMDYAIKDLRTKIPFLIIPFLFSSLPKLSHKKFEKLIYLFIGSVIFVSFYVTITHFVTHEEIRIIIGRGFISHIRFSLSVNLAIFYLIFLRVNNPNRSPLDMFSLLALFWLLFFLFFLEAFTGIVVFIVLVFSLLFYLIYKSDNLLKKTVFSGLILLGAAGIVIFGYEFLKENTTVEKLTLKDLQTKTLSGNLYTNNLKAGTENGKYIFVYICDKELEEAWEKRSILPFKGQDYHGQTLSHTLYRYLTSKGLRKDKEGVEALDIQDIKNVENGIANYYYTQGVGVQARLMKILFEYNNYMRTGNPSGHSVMQRFEFWKTSSQIINENWWFGVGTGDMNIAFKEQYEKMNSKLDTDYRLRAHNQYISIWVGLGFLGFLWFLFVLFYPPFSLHAFDDIYYFIFFIIATVSMLSEDTIETQAGLTFFIFFNSFFLFLYPSRPPSHHQS